MNIDPKKETSDWVDHSVIKRATSSIYFLLLHDLITEEESKAIFIKLNTWVNDWIK